MNKLSLTLLLLFALVPCMAQSQQHEVCKPNIIFIMADDLGYETLACNGNDTNKTPNLDKMTALGMRFTNAHSTPLCTPTRVQVMTGKYNNRNYIGFGLLDPAEKTFATLLRDAGYATAVAGKWQLLGNPRQQNLAGGNVGAVPAEVGFQEYSIWQGDKQGSRLKDPLITTPMGTKKLEGDYGPDVHANFALDFIDRHKDKSFFLYYPMILPHDPFQPTPDSAEYTTAGIDINDPVYFPDMVQYMDGIVGRILRKIHDVGISTNTLVIFTGDNGTGREVTSLVNGKSITGGKRATTNLGTHVPMIAYWDGVTKSGAVNDNLVDFTDILPTIMDVAGTSIPENFYTDGISFFPQLRSPETPGREWIFCYFEPRWKAPTKSVWAHTKDWKLYNDGRFYNLQQDPAEENPLQETQLSDAAKAVRSRLEEVIDEKLRPVR